jgi:hypothetical protein
MLYFINKTAKIPAHLFQKVLSEEIRNYQEENSEIFEFKSENIRNIQNIEGLECSLIGKFQYDYQHSGIFKARNSVILYEPTQPINSVCLLPSELRIIFQQIGFYPNLILRAHNRLPGDYSGSEPFYENPSDEKMMFMYHLGRILKEKLPQINKIGFYAHQNKRNYIKHNMHEIAKKQLVKS